MPTLTTTYQRSASSVARGQLPFQQRFTDTIRQVRRSAVLQSDYDDQLLDDFARGRGTVRIERLATIASTCTDVADATALADCFRAYALAARPSALQTVTEVEAMRQEQRADGDEDQAVYEYIVNPCQATRLRAIEALRRAVETSQVVIDALHRGARA